MSIDAAQLEVLSAVSPGARPLVEAGIDYVYLPGLRLVTGDTERVMDALLCPMQLGGYVTRLFLADPISGRGANWSEHHICGRTWHTWSWQGVPATMTLVQILSAHLKALR